MSTGGREGGFTLLEVLLALVIVVAGVSVVAQGFSAGTRAAAQAKQETMAAMLAERTMADLETGEASLTSGTSGTFADNDAFGYKVELEPDSAISGRTKVTVTISWGGEGEERSIALNRLMRERPTPP